MATYIKTLKDENGDIVLPRTNKSAIQDIINEVPSGGLANQVLTKTTDGYAWQDAQGGTGTVKTINGEGPDSSGNIEIAVATESVNGLMGSGDKAKLNGLSQVTESTVAGWGFTKNEGTVTTTGIMTATHVVVSNGNDVIKDSGYTIGKSVPSDAVFTDTVYDDTEVRRLIGSEAEARENADENLQEQIDAITSQSDVVDVVGTHAELAAYSKPIYKYDIVKVLVDETHSNAIAYYRCGGTIEPPEQPEPPYTWEYIGSQGPFYTKAETDNLLDNYYTKTETDILLSAKMTTPSGGTEGQVLTKTANSFVWADPTGGGLEVINKRRILDKGDIITMNLGNGSNQYRVLKKNGNVAEVLAMYEANSSQVWHNDLNHTATFSNGITGQQYNGCDLDTYLNTIWYNTLSAEAKAAIVATNINQDMWYWGSSGDPDYSGYYGTTNPGTTAYTISNANGTLAVGDRYIYALSVQDVLDYILDTSITDGQLQNYNIWKMFWDTTNRPSNLIYPWLRSANADHSYVAFIVDASNGRVDGDDVNASSAARPGFQIDLSKIAWA